MKRNLKTILWMMTVLTLLSGLCVPVQAEEAGETILQEVTLSEDGATLTASATLSGEFLDEYGAGGVYLFELAAHESTEALAKKAPVAERVASSEELTFTVDFSGADPQRKYSHYVLARQDGDSYTPISDSAYIDNVTVLAQNTAALPQTGSAAGMVIPKGTQLTDALFGCAVIPVDLSDLFADTADGAIRIEYGESVYYADKSVLTALDGQVRALSEDGVCVFLQLTLGAPDETTADLAELLYADGQANAVGYAPHTGSAESCRIYGALIEFLCDRYTREDGEHGFAGRFIFGDGINDIAHSFAGASADTEEYFVHLERTLRMTVTALRASYANARLYLSLTGDYSAPPEGGLSAKQLLTRLCADCGTLPFDLYVQAQSSDGGDAKFWEDVRSTDAADTETLSMKNIEVLRDLLATEPMLCEGYVRDLAVGFRADAGSNADLQAASLLCACYRVMTTDGISALIYTAPQDFEGSADGLMNEAGIPKRAYSALCEVRELDESTVTDRIRSLLGDEEYASLSEGIFADLFVSRTRIPLYSGDLPDEEGGEYLADFADGLFYNFSASSTTKEPATAILPDEGIVLQLTGKADKAGMSRSFNGYDLTGVDLLILNVMAQTDDPEAGLTLTMEGTREGESVILYGTSALTPGVWSRVAFTVTGMDTLDALRLEVSSGDASPLTLYAKSVTTYLVAPDASEQAVRVILWVLVAVLTVFLILWIRLTFMRARKHPAPVPARGRYQYSRRAPSQASSPAPHVLQSAHAEPERPRAEAAPKAERGIPTMPKTPPKTFVVPAKPVSVTRRDTMSLGIEPTSAVGGEQARFDTTAGTTGGTNE